jgi:3-oxoacyl-[acyl-carrier protein] reductase
MGRQCEMSRVALVTGASRGIGRAIAEHLAGFGHRVAIGYQARSDAAAEVAAGITALGGEAIAVAADVADEAAVIGMFEEVKRRLGPVEILVNNAGITRDGLILRMSVADWDAVIAADLRSAFLCSRAALRDMVRARWGRIVSVSSVVGLSGNAGQANYAAAKAGLIGLTRSIAKEVGARGITVNAVAPGFIETDMTAGISDPARAGILSGIAMGRFGNPEEVAVAVGYLASEPAGYVTGQVLVVDGGMSI